MLLSEDCVLCTYISVFHKNRKRVHQYPEFGPKPGEIQKKNLQKSTLALRGGRVTCPSFQGEDKMTLRKTLFSSYYHNMVILILKVGGLLTHLAIKIF
jgi:hypothetical protein